MEWILQNMYTNKKDKPYEHRTCKHSLVDCLENYILLIGWNVTMQWSNTTYCGCKLFKIYDLQFWLTTSMI